MGFVLEYFLDFRNIPGSPSLRSTYIKHVSLVDPLSGRMLLERDGEITEPRRHGSRQSAGQGCRVSPSESAV
jgi:hypothetical protein